MSSPEDLRDHDGSFDSDGEHDLTSNGILEVVRNDTEHFEPRRAFDHECSSPSPPPHEGGNRFFLGSNSADGTDEAFSPVMPDISISHADDQSFDYSRSGRDSFASDVPSVLQARGQHDPFATPVDEVPPTIRHFGSFGTLSGIYNGYDSPTLSFSPPPFSSPTSPPPFGGIASRRPGLSHDYSNPYMPNINSIHFQSSQNALLGTPSTPGSPLQTPLESPRPIPARMLNRVGSTAFSRDALASPPPRSLQHSLSVPVLRGTPRLKHTPSGYLRPATPSQNGVHRKPVLRRQRSTALLDFDDEVKDITTGGKKKKKPRYYDPLNSTIPKPWLQHKDRKELWSRLLTYSFILLGAICSALTCYRGAKSVKFVGNVCLVLDEDFSSSTLNDKVWFHEVDMGGFGNGEFEMTTASSNNSYIEDGVLYIVPTLTSENIGSDAVFNAHTYNLTGCTNANSTACSAISNSSIKAVINPIQSARISTLVNGSTSSIQYGRVEVRARMPKGDWLWPAIWMLPVNNTYGNWPMSGEIDIVESRGNNMSYTRQGINYVRASLNWGPNNFINSVWRTYGWFTERHKNFNDDFHTYTLEWTEEFMRIYIDTRLHLMLDLNFQKKSFWDRGDYPESAYNGSQQVPIFNPWSGRGNDAPFDQSFYLILNVAVGGTNGWFPDGAGGKPWLDGSLTPMYDFAKAQDQWYPTWPTDPKQRGMAVDSVKMWQKC